MQLALDAYASALESLSPAKSAYASLPDHIQGDLQIPNILHLLLYSAMSKILVIARPWPGKMSVFLIAKPACLFTSPHTYFGKSCRMDD